MSLFLAVLFVVQFPVHFSPDCVGIRYAQTSLSGSATEAKPASAGQTPSLGQPAGVRHPARLLPKPHAGAAMQRCP
jgi:hypothetical protein